MRVVLQISDGPLRGKRIRLLEGQRAIVGRAEHVQLSIPRDHQMSSIHFEMSCQDGECRLRDLESDSGTVLNGLRIDEAAIYDQDQIVAGQTCFAVSVQGARIAERTAPPAGICDSAGCGATYTDQPPVTPCEAGPISDTAASVCAIVQLGDDAAGLLDEQSTPTQFIERLVEKELIKDAANVLAAALPKRAAVSWASWCVRHAYGDHLSTDDAAALEVAEKWADDPKEEHRRAAEAAAVQLGYRTAASWTAAAAFWSGGSIAPPGAQEIPPEDTMMVRAIGGAVTLAAVCRSPEETNPCYRAFVNRGLELARDDA